MISFTESNDICIPCPSERYFNIGEEIYKICSTAFFASNNANSCISEPSEHTSDQFSPFLFTQLIMFVSRIVTLLSVSKIIGSFSLSMAATFVLDFIKIFLLQFSTGKNCIIALAL